jgi:hypothetical protein
LKIQYAYTLANTTGVPLEAAAQTLFLSFFASNSSRAHTLHLHLIPIPSHHLSPGGLAGNIMMGTLATTTGVSLAAAAPAVLLGCFASASGVGAAGLPAWAPSATPYVVQGNLLGLIGTVQTFALFRKLGVQQSEAFTTLAARLAWVVRMLLLFVNHSGCGLLGWSTHHFKLESGLVLLLVY